MSRPWIYVFTILFLNMALAADRPWQQIVMPSAAEVAANFGTPPPEYGVTLWWGWDGPMTAEVIQRDLDGFKARGVRVVTIEPGYDTKTAYLSPAWFELIKIAVEQARSRGMKVWLVDDGKYPSGFAGGKFSSERPELRMQALVVAERIPAPAGETVSRKLSADTVGAIAVNQADGANQILDVRSGELSWKAPVGNWQVLVVEHRFRSSATRAVNNLTRGKDDKNSLCDYLDPAATRQFLAFTHEQYLKYVGQEFGKTILGFRGDEPDYGVPGVPWTPAIFAEFQRRKGCDVRPYVAAFLAQRLTEEQQRAKADYWDVWSDMFGNNFFRVQADWCARHDLEYLVHLTNEERMMSLVRSEGDFFRDMRYVQVPGIDTIWNQIWPGKISDFPKYASSAAHLFGRPRAFTESFAAYNTPPNLEQAKWVLNQQFARGINLIEIMFTSSSAAKGQFSLSGWMASEQFPGTAAWIDRASYLLSMGRPTAQIGVYHPAASMWLGDQDANPSTLALMQQLLEHQRDFDFVDEQALGSVMTLRDGAFQTASGNQYRAVLVPNATAISRTSLDRLKTFAKSGGRVVFLGKTPSLVMDATFLKAGKAEDLSWAVVEPGGNLTERVLGALPQPDVALYPATPSVKYVHRRWRDTDVYFFFNESDRRQSAKAVLAGSGKVQVWDAARGQISALAGATEEKNTSRVALDLEPYESKFIAIGAAVAVR